MKLTTDQLSLHLQKTLAPIYLVCGEEILLRQQAVAMIRASAAEKGFSERKNFQIDTSFNWGSFLFEVNSFSLFNTKTLLELYIPDGKFNDTAKKTLESYAQNPAPDKMLLLHTTKLDSKAQMANWCKQIEKNGVIITAWPIHIKQLPGWIKTQLQQAGITADAAGIQLLADRSEGNLLAAKQAIEKLQLLYGSQAISADEIATAISDSARFTLFDLVDCALLGESKRTVQIILYLQAEGSEPTLVLWALLRELRSLLAMRQVSTNNAALDDIMLQHKVWEKRKPIIKQALRRHNVDRLQQLLQHASRIDYIIKGAKAGNVWDELLQLSLGLAGIATPQPINYAN